MKRLFFAVGLAACASAQTGPLTLTPDSPHAEQGAAIALLIGPAPACPAVLSVTGCELTSGGISTALVVVIGATTAYVSVTYQENGQEVTQTRAADTLGPNCSAEFVIPADATFDKAEVTVVPAQIAAAAARRRNNL